MKLVYILFFTASSALQQAVCSCHRPPLLPLVPAPAAGTLTAPAAFLFLFSCCRTQAAVLKHGDAVTLAALVGQQGFGWEGERAEELRLSAQCCRAAHLKICSYKIHLQNSSLPPQMVGSQLLVSAHSRHRQQDVEVLLLLQPPGFWLSFPKRLPLAASCSTQQEGGLQGSRP